MNLLGIIIQVDESFKAVSQEGKEYDAYRIVYTNDRGEIKNITKPLSGLKFKPKVRATLSILKQGDPFTAVLEKNNGGYLEIFSLEKGHQEVVDTIESKTESKPAGKVTGSNWETSEERALRQRYIVRQSSITAALTFLGDGAMEVKQVLDIAKQFEEFVFSKVGE